MYKTLQFIRHRDYHRKVRMVDADLVTPKNWPPGNLFMEVFEGDSSGKRVVRWDFTILGADASVAVPLSVWEPLIQRGMVWQLVWLPSGGGASATGDCEVAGPVVVVG